MEAFKRKKMVSELQLVLTLLFVVALVVSNIITSKQVLLPFNITMTGAVFIFPITYILSDLVSEVYGYRWSRLTCYFGFAANLFAALVFSAVIQSPAPSYWQNQEAFQTVLGSTPRVLVASLLAFVIGDFVNDQIFARMKRKYPDSIKGFGARAIFSSLMGELVDSLVFLPLAFWGLMPVQTLVIMTLSQVVIKTGYELVILPFTTIAVKLVSRYENRKVEHEY
nr:MAG TPA: Putative vitamin uptake transporter [Caudoviricetes sp.]